MPNNCPDGTHWDDAAKTCLCPDGLEPVGDVCSYCPIGETNNIWMIMPSEFHRPAPRVCWNECEHVNPTNLMMRECQPSDSILCAEGSGHWLAWSDYTTTGAGCIDSGPPYVQPPPDDDPPGEEPGQPGQPGQCPDGYTRQEDGTCKAPTPEPPQPPASGQQPGGPTGGAGGSGGAGGEAGPGGAGGAGGAGGNPGGLGQGGHGGQGGAGGAGGAGGKGGAGGAGGKGGDAGEVMCYLFPNSLACADIGTLPGEGDGIQRQTQDVAFNVEALVPFGGGCPADPTVSIMGRALQLPIYSKGCGFLVDYVRPLAILLASFFALFIALGGLKAD